MISAVESQPTCRDAVNVLPSSRHHGPGFMVESIREGVTISRKLFASTGLESRREGDEPLHTCARVILCMFYCRRSRNSEWIALNNLFLRLISHVRLEVQTFMIDEKKLFSTYNYAHLIVDNSFMNTSLNGVLMSTIVAQGREKYLFFSNNLPVLSDESFASHR